MNTLVILSCSKTKKKGRHNAKDLYISPAFKKGKELIELFGYDWKIISAKHGLLDPEEKIDSYEENSLSTFNGAGKSDTKSRKNLREKVRIKIESILANYQKIILMCGQNYRKALMPLLKDKEVLDFYKQTKGIGEILKKLDYEIRKKRNRPLDEFF